MSSPARSAFLVPALVAGLLAGSHGIPLSAVQEADEREEIYSYDVRVEVMDGGVFRVTEEILVNVLGREIRRGIYRDFPTSFPGERFGRRVVAPFRVISVERNGSPEPYRLESIGGPAGRGGVRVRIGDADVHLRRDTHRYTLVYETERWMRFGPERDRIEWNVTGNGWDFPIQVAKAEIVFPEPLPAGAVDLEAWTGPEGSTAQNATWSWDAGAGVARFENTRYLGPREGLTVRVDLPSGVVAPPTEAQEAAWFRLDWGGWLDAGVVVAFLVGLYLFMWMKVGRDPPAGTVVVRYQPPEGFSPAALGFLQDRGYDARQLTAALVSLAVKGRVRIEKDGGDWTIHRAEPGEDRSEAAGLAPEERELHDDLLSGSGRVELDGSPDSTVRSAQGRFRKALERRHERVYFLNNRRWFGAGVAFTLVGFAALAWRYRYDVPLEALFLGFWLSIWTIGVVALLARAGSLWRQAFTGSFVMAGPALFMSLFALPFLGAEVFVGTLLYRMVPVYLLAAAITLGAVNVLFYHLLERPTLKGRGVLDQLEGFRRFLGATEEGRIDRLQEPERSLELFERYLPHAIALGVESRWAEQFEGVLASASGAEGGSTGMHAPVWYAGSDMGSLGSLSSSLGSSFSSSLSASSASPSSGGGSGGGGGSSGGGGGGGGGGGW